MFFLDLITVLCIGPMIGLEFAVSAFVNPILWKLDRAVQAVTIPVFARKLGAVMPFWYALSLILLIAEAVMRHQEPGFRWLIAAGAIWAAVIVVTVIFLVPLNNRLARLNGGAFTDEVGAVHKTWDTSIGRGSGPSSSRLSVVCLTSESDEAPLPRSRKAAFE